MRWLLDEMFPPATAKILNDLGHEAVAIAEGARGMSDEEVLSLAVAEDRVVVTENVVDSAALLHQRIGAGQSVTPLVFVLKTNLPREAGALINRLAEDLHDWSTTHAEAFPTYYWS